MSSITSITSDVSGIVLRHKKNEALVRMDDGAERWFPLETERDRKQFAVGKSICCQRLDPPKNREELFAIIELLVPNVRWGFGIVRLPENPALVSVGLIAGAGDVKVFAAEDAEYFLVSIDDQDYRCHYADPAETEHGFATFIGACMNKAAA
jgi:hypothetical protein